MFLTLSNLLSLFSYLVSSVVTGLFVSLCLCKLKMTIVFDLIKIVQKYDLVCIKLLHASHAETSNVQR